MKTTETKTTSNTQHQHKAATNIPFFQKEGERSSFFSEIESDILQRSPFYNNEPFFNKKQETSTIKLSNVQTKLKIGQPNDKYEKEADATADRVVQKLSQPSAVNVPSVQKNEAEEKEQISKKEESLQRKPIFESADEPQIQAKPINNTLNQNQIQTQTETEEDIQEEPEQSELDLQTAPIFASSAPSDEDNTIQRQAEGTTAPSSDLESRLNSSSGGGSSLPDDTRSSMESAIGADFSGVRVHTGSEAVQMSNELGAQAFTHGSDIYFNEGKYNPSSSSGQHLLAHELVHTLQQGGSKPDLQTYSFGEAFDDVTNFASDVAGDVADAVGISVEDLRKYLAKFADKNVPGYSMLSVAIGYDVLRGIDVARNQDSVLKGVFSLINPLGSRLFELLKERGIIEEAFTWINTQLDNLGLTKDAMIEKLNYFLDNVKLATTSPIDDNIGTFKRTFSSVFRSILSFVSRTKDQVFSMVKKAFLEVLAKLAKELGGYDLLADLLGFDPITEEKRNASTADILRGILQLPIIQSIGGDKLLKKLEEHNLIDKTANWIDQQWGLLKGGFSDLLNTANKFLNGFSFETLKAPMKFVNEIKTDVVGFVTKIGKFFKNLASKALELIKEVSVFLLKKFVNENTYGFDLVKVILGKDPFTDEKFPRNAENIIGAFLKLLPQGEAVFSKLKETGAIQRTQAWIMNAIQEFVQILGAMKAAFVQLWSTSSIEDLFEPIAFFKKIMNLFTEPVKRMVAFVQRVLTKIFEVLLEIMKFPVKIVQKIIANITKAFHSIKKDPIGFLLRLLGAVKEGFTKFFDNIGKHLLAGVTGWLFGQVAKAGITPPKDLSLGSILDLVMQILGLTVDKLWNLLAKKIGQKKVDKIKGGLDKLKGVWLFVKDVMQNGIAAVWKYIKEKISNLWNIVLEEVKSWIITKIIEKVVTKLLSMLDPTGIMAVVNGFMAFFKAIQSAIEYFKQMLEVVQSFTGGIAEIATGAISTAAKFLENALVKALPVAISFLANQVGLGNIGKKLKEIIGKIQGFIEKALNWLVDKAMAGLKGIMGLFKGKDKEDLLVTNKDREKHKQIAVTIKKKLSESSSKKSQSFEEFYRSKKKEAGKLKQQYQPQLKQGIKLDIKFKPLTQDKPDGDLDIRVRIAPNTIDLPVVIPQSGRSFQLAHGGMESHEGHTILTSGKSKTIHLYSKHLNVTEAELQEELENWKGRFRDEKRNKKDKAAEVITSKQERINELTSSPVPKSAKKQAKRNEAIQKARNEIEKQTQYISDLDAIDENNRDQVMDALNRWSKSIGKMPTDKKTKFTKKKVMEKVIKMAIENNQVKINESLTDTTGNSKPKGTQTTIKQKFSGSNLGIGYEFDSSMNVVRIEKHLSEVECILVISNPFEFMVETAYLNS